MYTINDSMLALLLRFIGKREEVDLCDHEFIKKQIRSIQAHIDQFPLEEQELRAIEWIETYAREYRKSWEKEMLSKEFSNQRCKDCPLNELSAVVHCRIHDDWLDLLHQYGDGTINSTRYVEDALHLLTEHKEYLKVKLSHLKREGE